MTDRRTQNRSREHANHKLKVTREVEGLQYSTIKGPASLLKCECGWFGWIPSDSIVHFTITNL
jgi:hypothetical protein